MTGIKMLMADYARAIRDYHGTDPAISERRAHFAYRAASAALAIALRWPENRSVWSALSKEWERRMQPNAEAIA
jgi:hypothetical protein